jgi:hypothetical protein
MYRVCDFAIDFTGDAHVDVAISNLEHGLQSHVVEGGTNFSVSTYVCCLHARFVCQYMCAACMHSCVHACRRINESAARADMCISVSCVYIRMYIMQLHDCCCRLARDS